MSKLDRSTPLGLELAANEFIGKTAVIKQESFLGVAKLLTRKTAVSGSPLAGDPFGAPLPAQPNTVTSSGNLYIACTAPGEWLILGEEGEVDAACARAAPLLSGKTALLSSLTHGRASFIITKPGARDVLAALCPIDLHPRAFAVGKCATSLLGEAGVFLHQLDDAPTFRLIVDQVYAAYVWRMLTDAISSLDQA